MMESGIVGFVYLFSTFFFLSDKFTEIPDAVSGMLGTVSCFSDAVSDRPDAVSGMFDTVSNFSDTVSDLLDVVSGVILCPLSDLLGSPSLYHCVM